MANKNAAANLSNAARSKGGSNSGGNFKHDPQRAAKAGRKGGRASHGGGRKSATDTIQDWDEI